jgi:Subtilase family
MVVPNSLVFTTRPGAGIAAQLRPSGTTSVIDTHALQELRNLLKSEEAQLSIIRRDDEIRLAMTDNPCTVRPGLFVMRFRDDDEVERVLRILTDDDVFITSNRPSRFVALPSRLTPDWQLGHFAARDGVDDPSAPRQTARFDEIQYRPDSHAAPVTVIDKGYPSRDAFGRRLTYHGDASRIFRLVNHGLQVCGVLAGDAFMSVPRGCCAAPLDYWNAWVDRGGKPEYCEVAMHTALDRFLSGSSRVLNLSIASHCRDETFAAELRLAEQCGKVVVAAMPSEAEGGFPASEQSVVAVGHSGTYTPHHDCHALIAVASSDLVLLHQVSGFKRGGGSSFAAPAVSAAVWLAFEHCPTLTPTQIRDALGRSAMDRRAIPSQAAGWGRLDAYAFMRQVHGICSATDQIASPVEPS